MTAAPILARTLKYKVSVTNGANAGQNFVFDKAVVKIGRGPENDLVFSNDPKMSRSHAEIRLHLGQVIVRNVSQKNYILVNGDKVEEKTILGVGLLQVGETLLQIQLELPPEAKSSSAVAIPASHLSAVPSPTAKPVGSPVSHHGANSIAKPSAQGQGQSPAPQSYNMPPPPGSTKPSYQNSSAGYPRGTALGNSRIRFYAIIGIVGLVGYWLLSDSGGAKKQEVHIRTEGDIARAIEDSAKAVQELKKQQATTGQDTLQYRSAQEHYIKGFRDYRQGQYARAMQSFQAALSFYPSHELARKYLLQAQRKFEGQIDFNMSQGRKYYQRQNFRMCQSSFASVMIMVKDSAKPKYREAKQFYDECNLRLEGGY